MSSDYPLDAAYAERVYAGVLGKIVGVYLGRPFEQWSYEGISERLGTIEHYVHEELGVPLVVADDDISGTFAFARAFRDSGKGLATTARDIGETWQNAIIEGRTILWWGGLGASTEHTAFLRMKQGIEPPLSGSTELNGPIVSQQIGAQIFIDAWPMLAPADPGAAARLATEAARVSHDGVAVEAAVLLAVMESMAFVESDLDRLREIGLTYVSKESLLRTMIDDLSEWRVTTPDWREARRLFAERYGYEKFGGGCHMIPNHGLIQLALMWSNGDFNQAMTIVNTCGYDTDCNSGNVGCLLGLAQGLAAFEGERDWRGPVADRMLVPTAIGAETVTDAVAVANEIVDAARWARGLSPWRPKDGARFNFAYPGSVQGFESETAHVRHDRGGLEIDVPRDAAEAAFAGTPIFLMPDQIGAVGYGLVASPSVMPGAEFGFRIVNRGDTSTDVGLAVEEYISDDRRRAVRTVTTTRVPPGESADLMAPLCLERGRPICRVGLRVEPGARVFMDRSLETGGAEHTYRQPEDPAVRRIWQTTWTNACSDVWFHGDEITVIANEHFGFLVQSAVHADALSLSCSMMRPNLCEAFGLVWNYQGLRRWTAALFQRDGRLAVVRCDGLATVLATVEHPWAFGESVALRIDVREGLAMIAEGDQPVLRVEDPAVHKPQGAVGFLVDRGRTTFGPLSVRTGKSQ